MDDVEEILDRAENALRMAYHGYKQYEENEGERKQLAISNVARCGRSVTFILQNLRGKVDGFDEWYEPRKEKLKQDPTCSRMVEVRNKIVKEGRDSASPYVSVEHINGARLQAKSPDWADSIFVGDQYGGSGWLIEREGDEDLRFYYDFPDEAFETGLVFQRDEGDEKMPVVEDELGTYVRILAELVADAKSEFGE